MLYAQLKDIFDYSERIRTINHLIDLRKQLDDEIPEKTAENTLLLATWNIRQFTDNRKQESYFYIAEILSRFDLIAVQEVKNKMKGLERVMKILGKNWEFIATDVSIEKGGNGERIAFLYDTNKISFKNIAGEIVLPKTDLIQGMQFARTPFCVAFQAGWFKFNLATVHIFYGKGSGEDNERRQKEIKALGNALSKRAKSEKSNYIVLGDFNIPEVDDEYMVALESTGFTIPDAIKEHPTNCGAEVKHYDQIAFNLQLDKEMRVFTESVKASGAFDFTKSVYRDKDYEEYIPVMAEKKGVNRTGEEAFEYFHSEYRIDEMSDHMPLWVQLKVDFSAKYLQTTLKDAKKKLAEIKAKEEEAAKTATNE